MITFGKLISLIFVLSMLCCLQKNPPKLSLYSNTFTENKISVKFWPVLMDELCKSARKERRGLEIYLLKICSGLRPGLVMLWSWFMCWSLNMYQWPEPKHNFRVNFTLQSFTLHSLEKGQSTTCCYSMFFN